LAELNQNLLLDFPSLVDVPIIIATFKDDVLANIDGQVALDWSEGGEVVVSQEFVAFYESQIGGAHLQLFGESELDVAIGDFEGNIQVDFYLVVLFLLD